MKRLSIPIMAIATLAMAAPFAALASDIGSSDYSETAASNNQPPPRGWPAGMNPAQVHPAAREMMAGIKRWFNRIQPVKTSAGAANVQTLTYDVAEAAYVTGEQYSFIAGYTNTAAATLNVSGLGAKAIQAHGAPLVYGDIIAGEVVKVYYDGTQFQLVDNRVVRDIREFGAKCDWDGTTGTDDTITIQAALDWAGSRGGGALTGPPGAKCKLTDTVTISKSFTVLDTRSGRSTVHSTGSNGQGNLGFYWSGGASPMMIVTPGGTQALAGVVIKGVSFLCNGVATIGLSLLSERAGHFDVNEEECVTAGVKTNSIASFTENSNFMFNELRVSGIQVTNAAPILWMTGTTDYNSSFNHVYVDGNYKNASAIAIGDADNNNFYNPHLFLVSPGVAYGVDCGQQGSAGTCRSNNFWGLSATSIFRGTDTQATATIGNMVYGLDLTNAVANPVVGTGAQIDLVRQDGVRMSPPYGQLFTGITASNTPAFVATEQYSNVNACHTEAANYGQFASGIFCNGSTGSLYVFTDGINRFRWRFNGSALSLDRLTGTYPLVLPANTKFGNAPISDTVAPTLGTCTGLGLSGSCAVGAGSNSLVGVINLTVAGAAPAATGTVPIVFPAAMGSNSVSCSFTAVHGTAAWTAPATFAVNSGVITTGLTVNWINGGATALSAGFAYAIGYQCRGF